MAISAYLLIKYRNSTIIQPNIDKLKFLKERDDYESKIVELYDLSKERFIFCLNNNLLGKREVLTLYSLYK